MRITLLFLLTLLLGSFSELRAGSRTTEINGPTAQVARNSIQTYTTNSRWNPWERARLRGHTMKFDLPAGMTLVDGTCTFDDQEPNGEEDRVINAATLETDPYTVSGTDVLCECTLRVNVGTSSGTIRARNRVNGSTDSSDEIFVNVAPLPPTPTFFIDGPDALCLGGADFNRFRIGSNVSTSYGNIQWTASPAGNVQLSSTTSSSISITPLVEGGFFLSVSFTPSATGQPTTLSTFVSIDSGQECERRAAGEEEQDTDLTEGREDDLGRAGPRSTTVTLSPNQQSLDEPGFAYPNPAITELTVPLAAGSSPTDIRLFDASGRQVRQQQAAPGVSSSRLNTTGLSPGTYVLQLSGGGRTSTQKVTIQ